MQNINWGNNKPCYIVAELGCNHCGDVEIAEKMIEEAAKAGVNCVKIQKRDIDSLNAYSEKKVYDNPNSFGKTYTKHREKLELSIKDIDKLKFVADVHKLDFAASCWDQKSIDDMKPYIDYYKLQSADNINEDLVNYLAQQRKPVMVSTGGTNYENFDKTYKTLCKTKQPLSVLHCTSVYPLPFDMVNLNCIKTLQERYPKATIGYSGHENGIAVSVAAVALGAKIVERHFTLDRTMKGGDQAASLEPQGLKKLVRDIRAVEEAMGSDKKKVYDVELEKLASLNKTRKPFNWRMEAETYL